MLTCERIEVAFGDRTLFSDVSLRIDPGDKIGLLGRNGSGKSTLFKLLTKQTAPDRGQVQWPKLFRVAHVSQDTRVDEALTPTDFLLSRAEERTQVIERLKDAEQRLAAALEGEGDEEAMFAASSDLSELTEHLSALEQVYGEAQAASVLAGLGLSPEQQGMRCGELSGGWRLRVALAAALFQRPDLLLLDEPTNHLDLPSVLWLMEYLKRYEPAVVLTSHDGEFLDAVAKRLWLIELGRVVDFVGNRSALRAKLEENAETEARTQAKLESRAQEIDAFVKRFRAQASKAAQVQSRIKELEKLDAQRQGPAVQQGVPSFRLPEPPSCGRTALEIEDVSLGYGETIVLRRASAVIRAGEKVAIVGANGAGKSTLLKAIAGVLRPQTGEVRFGARVEPLFIGQHLEDEYSGSESVFQWAYSRARHLSESRIRGILAALGFDYEAQKKPLSVLSGGERARLAYSGLSLTPGNLILLDEPTNHLDLESCDAMIEGLRSFAGTVLIVSHHQDLLHKLPTALWVVEGGEVVPFAGDYTRYKEVMLGDHGSAAGREGSHDGPKVGKKAERAQRAQARATERLEREVAAAEAEVEAAEAEVTRLEAAMSSERDAEKLMTLEQERQTQRNRAQSAVQRWSELGERLDAERPRA